MPQEFLDLRERCSSNVHASVVPGKTCQPSKHSSWLVILWSSTPRHPPSPRHPPLMPGLARRSPSPAVGSRPPDRTKRTKAKDAPTDDFCLSSYQRGYALESKRATLRRACIAHLSTTGPEISCKGVCIGRRIRMSRSVSFTA